VDLLLVLTVTAIYNVRIIDFKISRWIRVTVDFNLEFWSGVSVGCVGDVLLHPSSESMYIGWLCMMMMMMMMEIESSFETSATQPTSKWRQNSNIRPN